MTIVFLIPLLILMFLPGFEPRDPPFLLPYGIFWPILLGVPTSLNFERAGSSLAGGKQQAPPPPWAAAVTAQIQKVFTEQLEDHLAAQAQANRAELQELIEE